jgi:hypothetical protein
MALSLNLDKLFSTEKGYLREIAVPEDDHSYLRACRDEIRECVAAALAGWKDHIARTDLFETALAKSFSDAATLRPKFRLQGSFDYHTVNDCQQTPPQQIDMDDGVFLPVGFLTDGGRVRPGLVSKAYFNLVEGALKPLCAKHGWRLRTDKNSCIRVEVGVRLHIDLPLYAVQDQAFEKLVEVQERMLAKAAFDARDHLLLPDDLFAALDASEIFLAHRQDGWIVSDPRKLGDWFQSAIVIYGVQLRRLARIFKGLRDYNWSSCGLSSIAIMAAMVSARSRLLFVDPNRDDLAVLQVGREMVSVFGGPIENPVFPGEQDKFLCKDWTPTFRQEVHGVFAKACDELELAINISLVKSLAISRLRAVFGPRIPDDESLIHTLGVAATVRETPPQPMPRPMAPRTRSG